MTLGALLLTATTRDQCWRGSPVAAAKSGARTGIWSSTRPVQHHLEALRVAEGHLVGLLCACRRQCVRNLPVKQQPTFLDRHRHGLQFVLHTSAAKAKFRSVLQKPARSTSLPGAKREVRPVRMLALPLRSMIEVLFLRASRPGRYRGIDS